MHVYIYDLFLNQKKFNSTLSRIETRITDLGLNGKIIRLNETSSLFAVIEQEIKKNIKTLTVVGDNNILNNTINSILKIYKNNQSINNTPIGFIPINNQGNNSLASQLGIEIGVSACDILASRRIQQIDLGKINNNYFIFQAEIEAQNTFITINNSYSLETQNKGLINIINLPLNDDSNKDVVHQKNKGYFELFIQTKKSTFQKNRYSNIYFKKLSLHNPNHEILIDNSFRLKTPVEIEVAKEKIQLIVGKNRKF